MQKNTNTINKNVNDKKGLIQEGNIKEDINIIGGNTNDVINRTKVDSQEDEKSFTKDKS